MSVQSDSFVGDSTLDLVFERVIDVPREKVWAAWTQPELLKQWFTPAPWKTVACELDLRPGGKFHTVMQSPEGQEFPNTGCYLEVVENEKLVWTNAFAPGFRPLSVTYDGHECNEFLYTVVLTLTPQGNGTKYHALVLHMDEDGCKKHQAMGFHQGWNAALDQLIELVKNK